MNRRNFLAGILAAGVAPVFVKSGLMKILMPSTEVIVFEDFLARDWISADDLWYLGAQWRRVWVDEIERKIVIQNIPSYELNRIRT